jgi:hypothetical protein
MAWTYKSWISNTGTSALNFAALSLAEGDLLVITVGRNSGQQGTPTDWTLIDFTDAGGSWGRLTTFYRIWHTGDATTVTFPSAVASQRNMVADFTHSSLPISYALRSEIGAFANNITVPSLTTIQDDALLIAATCGFDHVPATPSTFTLIRTETSSSGVDIGMFYKIQAAAGASSTANFGTYGSSKYSAGQIMAFYPTPITAAPFFETYIIG